MANVKTEKRIIQRTSPTLRLEFSRFPKNPRNLSRKKKDALSRENPIIALLVSNASHRSIKCYFEVASLSLIFFLSSYAPSILVLRTISCSSAMHENPRYTASPWAFAFRSPAVLIVKSYI
jgi:hypothetical protein